MRAAGKVYTARAKNAILACWHVVIPYICEELPDKQKEALASAQKVPLLYTNVLCATGLRSRRSERIPSMRRAMYHSR